MIDRARILGHIASHLGLRWIGFRAALRLKERSGYYARKLPVRSWAEQPLSSFLRDGQVQDPDSYRRAREKNPARFFFSANQRPHYQKLLQALDQPEAKPDPAEDMGSGNFFH